MHDTKLSGKCKEKDFEKYRGGMQTMRKLAEIETGGTLDLWVVRISETFIFKLCGTGKDVWGATVQILAQSENFLGLCGKIFRR